MTNNTCDDYAICMSMVYWIWFIKRDKNQGTLITTVITKYTFNLVMTQYTLKLVVMNSDEMTHFMMTRFTFNLVLTNINEAIHLHLGEANDG